MKKLKLVPFKELTTEGMSTRVLYILIGLSVIVFAAFYLVGYNMPYEEDPTFNAPLCTDLLLFFMFFLLIIAVVVAIVAVWRSVKMREKGDEISNGIPASKIAYSALGLLVASLLLTFLFGSSEPLKINGQTFSDTFWLKTTDMFVNTSLIMLFAAIGSVLYGLSRYNRKMREKGDK